MTISAPDQTEGCADAQFALLFPRGSRPTAADLSAMAGEAFSLVHCGPEEEGWAEVLVTGMSFEVAGLAPAAPPEFVPIVHRFGFPEQWNSVGLEAILIRPGPHLADGASLLPVVRASTALALAICARASAQAVAWLPAHSLMAREYFAEVAAAWLKGGAFPALGMTALVDAGNGGLRSQGLAYFTGQEIEIEPSSLTAANDDAKLAVRLVHRFVSNGTLAAPVRLTGTDGAPLLAELSEDGTTVKIWRQT